MGIIQVLPYRDRSGRRVVAIAGHGIIDHYNDLDPITLVRTIIRIRFRCPLQLGCMSLSFCFSLSLSLSHTHNHIFYLCYA
jgi:hypothetical protein